MPKTKEEQAEYNRAYYLANKEKTSDQRRAYRFANKEKAAEYHRAYRLANKEKMSELDKAYRLANREKVMIDQWRRHGHYIPEGTEHDAYVRFRDTTHCEFCGWEMIEASDTPRTNSKCRHHDHDIDGADNFIAVICNVCNVREKRCDNTSGESNIRYRNDRGKWLFMISYCGKRHSKADFKTFEEALSYKAAWFALNSPAVFHVPSWTVVLP